MSSAVVRKFASTICGVANRSFAIAPEDPLANVLISMYRNARVGWTSLKFWFLKTHILLRIEVVWV